jgi:acetyl-CoA carboxylase biotin carboxyl carrier protein
MNLTNEDVQDILALIDSTNVDELHLRTAHFALSLRRCGGGWTQTTTVHGQSPSDDPAPGTRAPRPQLAQPDAVPSRDGLLAVRAPLPGTFYRAPKPGAPPFVDVGARVELTTVIGIIETMKLMTSVAAGVAGTVVEICVGNGEVAAQDAVLVRVDPGPP